MNTDGAGALCRSTWRGAKKRSAEILAGLRRGDVATTVEYYEGDGSENGYDLEVFSAFGHTVVNVLDSQLEALRDDELLTVRQHELTTA